MKAAYEMFRKGLVVSEMSGNLEYRKDLLGQMADLTYDMGDYLRQHNIPECVKDILIRYPTGGKMNLKSLLHCELNLSISRKFWRMSCSVKNRAEKCAVIAYSHSDRYIVNSFVFVILSAEENVRQIGKEISGLCIQT